jgi:hypothetical protein
VLAVTTAWKKIHNPAANTAKMTKYAYDFHPTRVIYAP